MEIVRTYEQELRYIERVATRVVGSSFSELGAVLQGVSHTTLTATPSDADQSAARAIGSAVVQSVRSHPGAISTARHAGKQNSRYSGSIS